MAEATESERPFGEALAEKTQATAQFVTSSAAE
jgi:hypothetical protein